MSTKISTLKEATGVLNAAIVLYYWESSVVGDQPPTADPLRKCIGPISEEDFVAALRQQGLDPLLTTAVNARWFYRDAQNWMNSLSETRMTHINLEEANLPEVIRTAVRLMYINFPYERSGYPGKHAIEYAANWYISAPTLIETFRSFGWESEVHVIATEFGQVMEQHQPKGIATPVVALEAVNALINETSSLHKVNLFYDFYNSLLAAGISIPLMDMINAILGALGYWNSNLDDQELSYV